MDTLPQSPVELMALLTETINTVQDEIQTLERNRSDVRTNHTLSNKEQSILALGLDVLIVRAERDLARLQTRLQTQRMKFQKETFWRNL